MIFFFISSLQKGNLVDIMLYSLCLDESFLTNSFWTSWWIFVRAYCVIVCALSFSFLYIFSKNRLFIWLDAIHIIIGSYLHLSSVKGEERLCLHKHINSHVLQCQSFTFRMYNDCRIINWLLHYFNDTSEVICSMRSVGKYLERINCGPFNGILLESIRKDLGQ